MKKFLKIAGIICLVLLMWVALIGGMLFLFSRQAKKDINEMAENMEITTGDTKDTTEESPEISINITQNNSAGQQSTSDEYYDTMQEALLNATISLESEEQYRRNIDEVIKEFEGNEYTLIFYRSVKDKKEEAFNYAYFKTQFNEKKQYSFNKMNGTTLKYNSLYLGNAKEVIENSLFGSEFRDMGVDTREKRFISGAVREDFFEEGESIDALKVEGQKPDEIIEYESFGKKWYFWYYNDLQSDKPSSELEVTLTE